MNILAAISNRFSLTQAQKRLIFKELQSSKEFDDLYGITGTAQKIFFFNAVKKYCPLSSNVIDAFVY